MKELSTVQSIPRAKALEILRTRTMAADEADRAAAAACVL
jgi:hypothetical protein